MTDKPPPTLKFDIEPIDPRLPVRPLPEKLTRRIAATEAKLNEKIAEIWTEDHPQQ